MKSMGPPGAYGTTIRIGLTGYGFGCAAAGPAPIAIAAYASTALQVHKAVFRVPAIY